MNKEVFQHILSLSKEQSKALQKEDLEQFQNLMDKKQEIFDCINWEDIAIYRLNKEINDIIEEIKNVDECNKEEFNKQFEAVKNELCRIRTMKKRENYYSNPYTLYNEEGMFIDKH